MPRDTDLPAVSRDETPTDYAIQLRLRVFPTQRAAAEYFGVDPGTLSKYEKEKLTPRLGYLAELMRLVADQVAPAGTAPVERARVEQFFLAQVGNLLKWFPEEYSRVASCRNWAQLRQVANAYLVEHGKVPNDDPPAPIVALPSNVADMAQPEPEIPRSGSLHRVRGLLRRPPINVAPHVHTLAEPIHLVLAESGPRRRGCTLRLVIWLVLILLLIGVTIAILSSWINIGRVLPDTLRAMFSYQAPTASPTVTPTSTAAPANALPATPFVAVLSPTPNAVALPSPTQAIVITKVVFEPPSPSNADTVICFVSTKGCGGVGVGLRVSVNMAADGSATGEWRVIKELGVPDFTQDDAPRWDTLDYETGTHRVLVEALACDGTTVRDEELYTLQPERPGRPRQILPADKSTVASRTVTFQWQPTLRATSYTLIVGTSPNFGEQEVLHQQATQPALTYTFPIAYPHLYWWVIANNDYGATNQGPQTFTIAGSAGEAPAATPPP